jgi:hypothetical protein
VKESKNLSIYDQTLTCRRKKYGGLGVDQARNRVNITRAANIGFLSFVPLLME